MGAGCVVGDTPRPYRQNSLPKGACRSHTILAITRRFQHLGGGEFGAEGEDVPVGVGEDEVAEAVELVRGVGEDVGAALADEGAVVVNFFGDDDDRAAAEGAVPDGVVAEVEIYLAEGDAGVVVVAEVFGEAEDVAVEGDGGGDVGDLEDGGGGGGEHGGSIASVRQCGGVGGGDVERDHGQVDEERCIAIEGVGDGVGDGGAGLLGEGFGDWGVVHEYRIVWVSASCSWRRKVMGPPTSADEAGCRRRSSSIERPPLARGRLAGVVGLRLDDEALTMAASLAAKFS